MCITNLYVYQTVFGYVSTVFFFINQVTYVLREVVPFCKSGHIYILKYLSLLKSARIMHETWSNSNRARALFFCPNSVLYI